MMPRADPPPPAGPVYPASPVLRWTQIAYEYVLGMLTVAMVGVVVAGVWARYVLGNPLVYSFDLSTLLFAWVVFSGIAIARLDDAHLGVDLVGDQPVRLRRLVHILREAVVVAVSAYMAWLAFRLTLRTGVQITSMRMSSKWLYAAMPVGFALMTGLSAVRLVLLFVPGRRVP